MPSGWIETHALYITISGEERLITNRREINVKDLERYDNYSGDIPYYYFWTFAGTQKIKFVGSTAVNGSAYNLYYFEEPTTALDDNTDVSLIPERYRQAPIYKAASNLVLQIGQYTRSTALLQMYDRLMLQAQAESERWYTNTNIPTPDLNILASDPVDIQGQGEF